MAFRTANQQAQGLSRAIDIAGVVRSRATNAVISLQAGSVTADQVFQLIDDLRSALTLFAQVAAIPGIAAYAQEQFSDPTYDIAAEFNQMVASINAVVAWVVANFPADTQGFVQAYKLNSDGSRAVTSFTPAQTAGLVTVLNAVVAQIA